MQNQSIKYAYVVFRSIQDKNTALKFQKNNNYGNFFYNLISKCKKKEKDLNE